MLISSAVYTVMHIQICVYTLMHSYIASDPFCLLYYGLLFFLLSMSVVGLLSMSVVGPLLIPKKKR